MKHDTVGDHIGVFGLAVVVDKVPIRIDEVDNDSVVNYVIIVIIPWSRAEVDAVGFTGGSNLKIISLFMIYFYFCHHVSVFSLPVLPNP